MPVEVLTVFDPLPRVDAPLMLGAAVLTGVDVTVSVVAVDLATPAGAAEFVAVMSATSRLPAADAGITSAWFETFCSWVQVCGMLDEPLTTATLAGHVNQSYVWVGVG